MKTRTLLTEKQVAEILNVSIITLRNWRHLGRGLPYVKFGRAVRYPLEEVEKFIATNVIEPRRKVNES